MYPMNGSNILPTCCNLSSIADRLACCGLSGAASAYEGSFTECRAVGSGAIKSGGPSDGVVGATRSRALKSESVKLR